LIFHDRLPLELNLARDKRGIRSAEAPDSHQPIAKKGSPIIRNFDSVTFKLITPTWNSEAVGSDWANILPFGQLLKEPKIFILA